MIANFIVLMRFIEIQAIANSCLLILATLINIIEHINLIVFERLEMFQIYLTFIKDDLLTFFHFILLIWNLVFLY